MQKVPGLTDLQLVSFVCSPGEDQTNEVDEEHGAYCCHDNKVFGFSEVGELAENLSEINGVRCYKEVSTECR